MVEGINAQGAGGVGLFSGRQGGVGRDGTNSQRPTFNIQRSGETRQGRGLFRAVGFGVRQMGTGLGGVNRVRFSVGVGGGEIGGRDSEWALRLSRASARVSAH